MPITIPRGGHLINAFAKALKLDRPIVSMKLDLHCSQPTRVTVEFLATTDDDAAMRSVVGEMESGVIRRELGGDGIEVVTRKPLDATVGMLRA